MQTKFWIWNFSIPVNCSSDSIAKLSNLNDSSEIFFNVGNSLDLDTTFLSFICPKEIIGDCIYNNKFSPLISEKFHSFLTNFPEIQVDFYQSRLIEEETETLHEYFFLANFTRLISALDIEKSDFDVHPVFPESIGKIRTLVIDSTKSDKFGIFRLKEYPTALIVEDDLKRLIDKQNFTGIQWVPVEQFRTLG